MVSEEAPEDDVDPEEAQVQREWYIWLVALAVVGSIGLWVAPADLVPGLVRGLAPLFALIVVIGWAIKVVYQRWG